jgi:hypothetical protein
MLLETAPWPLLVLYSDADRMMPAVFVERVVRAQEAMGQRTVRSHNFVTSDHVAHMKAFPEVYSKQVEEFLKLC